MRKKLFPKRPFPQVYDKVVVPLVEKAVKGGCSSLFMYGQTGSGKTFTMVAMHEMLATHLFDTLRVGVVQVSFCRTRLKVEYTFRLKLECFSSAHLSFK